MKSEKPQSVYPNSKRLVRRSIVGLVSFLLGLWMIRAPEYLAGFEGSAWQKTMFLLLPWLILGLFASQLHRIWPADELEVLMNRQALAFAFYTAFFGVLAIYHLQAAGYMPDFTWRSRDMLAGLALLMLLGFGLSKIRYH